MRSQTLFLLLVALVISPGHSSLLAANAPDAPAKPKVAVFPLGGNASASLKERVGFSLRTKLDNAGVYEPIPGPTMLDDVGDKTITLATAPDSLKPLVDDDKPVLFIWGELNDVGGGQGGQKLVVKILDTRQKDAKPREISKTINDPTELRFAIEQILETIKDVKPFEHPNESSLTDDPEARKLWEKNPNLVPDFNFASSGPWRVHYLDQEYAPPVGEKLPAVDKVCILKQPYQPGREPHNVLAMSLSKECAENNGMACLSDYIKIEPNTRYRLQFKYKSDGPSLHVFVKGYTMGPSAVEKVTDGKPKIVKREVYKRQVPPSGGTDGKWVTIIDDMNPQNPTYPVQYLRVDLYAYLTPGVVMFDDIQLKAVGAMTHRAKDDAIKPAPGK
ncbi:MAG TPA: hypothetical protein VFE47_16740 [Tepidisphaeraceae bacterium]|jgi:hypothetical protein|nr:hypothetical protein [Tepidisphaeraceae bacterium]